MIAEYETLYADFLSRHRDGNLPEGWKPRPQLLSAETPYDRATHVADCADRYPFRRCHAVLSRYCHADRPASQLVRMFHRPSGRDFPPAAPAGEETAEHSDRSSGTNGSVQSSRGLQLSGPVFCGSARPWCQKIAIPKKQPSLVFL